MSATKKADQGKRDIPAVQYRAQVDRCQEVYGNRQCVLAPGHGGDCATFPQRKLTHQLVVRVDDNLYAALLEDAEHYGRTVAQSARHAMTRHLGVLPWRGTKP